jgi:hypothetical protein
VSVRDKPTECPVCGADFQEIGRVEANEFGPGNPPEDMAIYECLNPEGYHEFESGQAPYV